MTADLRTLAEQAEATHGQYRLHFSGRSRVTRDLDLLDRLIAELTGLETAAAELPDAADTLVPTLGSRLELYRKERNAIQAAKDGGPDEILASRAAQWTWLIHRRYIRNFAGQSRATRDRALLAELAAEQKRLRDELAVVARRHSAGWKGDLLASMQRNLELYTKELGEVKTAQDSVSGERRGSMLAAHANNQFALWRKHFQKKARHTRRVRLLKRMIAGLDETRTQMEAARDGGLRTSSHIDNLGIVSRRLGDWRSELSKIEGAVGHQGPDRIGPALGEEANLLFRQYRTEFAGKSRAQVDLDLLGDICEQLQELTRTMDDLDRTWARPQNAKNRDITLDNLKQYEREWEAIKAAKVN